MNKFEQLGLSESLLKAILDLGFENQTEVQEKAIIGKDTDMVALLEQGQENSSIGFPVIQKIDANNRNTQINFISNTRTLFADYQRN
jgi:ATP-dependent RNA helicase DeaD